MKYIFLYMKFMVGRLAQKVQKKKVTIDFNIWNKDELNKKIGEKLDKNEPFCLMRPGNGEYSFVQQYDEYRFFKSTRYRKQKMYKILDKNEKLVEQWCKQFREDLKDVDIFAFFSEDALAENYLMKAYGRRDVEGILLKDIESHIANTYSWMQHLERKKVLIINPFVDQIKIQYAKRKEIWNGKNVIPEMDLRYLKSVWYLDKDDNDGFETWFDALDFLKREVDKIDFDVALISCGPFSSFLAAYIKRKGKTSIQYGGALQMLFGIKGARWDNNAFYKQFFNDNWIRASKSGIPKQTEIMDDACYW